MCGKFTQMMSWGKLVSLSELTTAPESAAFIGESGNSASASRAMAP